MRSRTARAPSLACGEHPPARLCLDELRPQPGNAPHARGLRMLFSSAPMLYRDGVAKNLHLRPVQIPDTGALLYRQDSRRRLRQASNPRAVYREAHALPLGALLHHNAPVPGICTDPALLPPALRKRRPTTHGGRTRKKSVSRSEAFTRGSAQSAGRGSTQSAGRGSTQSAGRGAHAERGARSARAGPARGSEARGTRGAGAGTRAVRGHGGEACEACGSGSRRGSQRT